jgi:hypothetical protein
MAAAWLVYEIYQEAFMSNIEPEPPKRPERVRAFARFFKNYMSISALVVASLPIPVTALKLIPTFKGQTGILSVYTPLFYFLTLGFIFYIRHFLAKAMFSDFLKPYNPLLRPLDLEPSLELGWENATEDEQKAMRFAIPSAVIPEI